jgi:ATP-binding cassette, subfamily B, bacterial
LILSGGYAAVFVYGGHRVIAGSLSVGAFVAFLAYQMRLLQPVQALMGLYASLATVQVSLARVQELLDAPPDVVEQRSPVRLQKIRGEIRFDRVSLDLGRGPVLSALSFAIEPGEMVALVGPSGSGKSTIADLLIRLIDPDEGTIAVDGNPLTTVSLEDLRRRVVLVDQEPFVFHASISENIRYVRPDASEDDVRRAARSAGLDAFITSQPRGYHTIVGERGAALSAGERQRLAIARALLARPDVLVLDEPTAALDPETERHVIAEYRRLMHGRTVVVITHRAAVAEAADRVLMLTGGAVVERTGAYVL